MFQPNVYYLKTFVIFVWKQDWCHVTTWFATRITVIKQEKLLANLQGFIIQSYRYAAMTIILK